MLHEVHTQTQTEGKVKRQANLNCALKWQWHGIESTKTDVTKMENECDVIQKSTN